MTGSPSVLEQQLQRHASRLRLIGLLGLVGCLILAGVFGVVGLVGRSKPVPTYTCDPAAFDGEPEGYVSCVASAQQSASAIPLGFAAAFSLLALAPGLLFRRWRRAEATRLGCALADPSLIKWAYKVNVQLGGEGGTTLASPVQLVLHDGTVLRLGAHGDEADHVLAALSELNPALELGFGKEQERQHRPPGSRLRVVGVILGVPLLTLGVYTAVAARYAMKRQAAMVQLEAKRQRYLAALEGRVRSPPAEIPVDAPPCPSLPAELQREEFTLVLLPPLKDGSRTWGEARVRALDNDPKVPVEVHIKPLAQDVKNWTVATDYSRGWPADLSFMSSLGVVWFAGPGLLEERSRPWKMSHQPWVIVADVRELKWRDDLGTCSGTVALDVRAWRADPAALLCQARVEVQLRELSSTASEFLQHGLTGAALLPFCAGSTEGACRHVTGVVQPRQPKPALAAETAPALKRNLAAKLPARRKR